jgi:lysozyme
MPTFSKHSMIRPIPTCASALLFALVLAGCSSSGGLQRNFHGDSKPHDGVSRAYQMPVQGIDISRYQGEIDWNRVRSAGVRFAYMKVSEGGDHVDESFYRNWSAASRAGVARGVYHFMYWCRTAAEQAVWFSHAVPHDPTQLPPVLDLEWNHASATCPKRVPRDVALEKIRKMLEIMEYHTGKRPVIYTDINFHRDVLEGELKGYEFWLRSVAAEPHERYRDRPWTFWQYTATGRVPGVAGNVDRNVFNGSESEWRKWLSRRGVGSTDAVSTRIVPSEDDLS